MEPTRGRLIAIRGAIGSGKSTVADRLVRKHGFERHRFAEPIKRMLAELLRAARYSERSIFHILDGDRKEEPIPEFGMRSSRYAQQTLGSEWGREAMDPFLWVRLTMPKIEIALEQGRDVVVDDLRLPNEYDTLATVGAYLVEVRGRYTPSEGADHPAENALHGYPFHARVSNTDGSFDLMQKADRLVTNMPDDPRAFPLL